MNSPRSRPLSRLLFVLAAVAVTVLGLVAPASAAEPYCGITWGSLPKELGGGSGPHGGPVTNVRAGQHACFDRLVVDLAEPSGSGYFVQYVPEVTEDATGFPVPLRGGAFLQVVVRAPAYDELGNPTYRPADPRELVDTEGFATFRQVAEAGSFEGTTTLGLGVRARLPFRVFTLAGPGSDGRVVIDVAHFW
jgi:hypothetical protein